MTRAAGDSKYYTFAPLAGTSPLLGDVFKLPSVTSIIKDLTGEGWGPGSYRGFKLGIRSQHPRMSDERIEELYTKAKRGPWDPNKQLALAAVRGSRAHEIAEMLGKGYIVWNGLKLDSRNELLDGYSRAACLYFEQEQPQVIAVEKLVYSLKLGYAGTADLIRAIEPDQGQYGSFGQVVDFKTHKPNREEGSNGAYYTDELQVAMYAYAWEEMQGRHTWNGEVVTLQEDGSYLIKRIQRDFRVPEHVMSVWREKHYE